MGSSVILCKHGSIRIQHLWCLAGKQSHQTDMANDKLSFILTNQPKRQAGVYCVVQQGQCCCLLVIDTHPRNSEAGWVMQGEDPLPYWLLSPLTFSCLAALRHSDVGPRSLSNWIRQQRDNWPRFVICYRIPPPPPSWACGITGAAAKHTLQIQTYTDKHSKKEMNETGKGETRSQVHVGFE